MPAAAEPDTRPWRGIGGGGDSPAAVGLDAATAGADLDDLKLIAQAAYEVWRAQEPDPEDVPRGRGFRDRFLHLETTLDRAGRIGGDLTPECAAAVTAVLEAIGKTCGPEDLRTAGQRNHDALQEACALLIAACWMKSVLTCRAACGCLSQSPWWCPCAQPLPWHETHTFNTSAG
jgi:hypothetical protein